jgi:hypothetical protein
MKDESISEYLDLHKKYAVVKTSRTPKYPLDILSVNVLSEAENRFESLRANEIQLAMNTYNKSLVGDWDICLYGFSEKSVVEKATYFQSAKVYFLGALEFENATLLKRFDSNDLLRMW